MKMENLNKTQIVLLTLLVSFVTSIATGIITVTLMDQAPAGVTQTINRIVERTVETVLPGENQVTTVVKEVIIKEENLIANAVEKLSKSLVRINAVDADGVEISLGLGVIISGDGYIVTDKNNIEGNRNNLIIKYNNESFKADIVSNEDDEVAILKINTTPDDLENTEDKITVLTPASLADSEIVKLGQVIVSFSGTAGDTILTGIVSRLDKEKIETEDAEGVTTEVEKLNYIITNLDINKKSAGSPIIDIDGNILGINIIPSQDRTMLSIPINNVKKVLFKIVNDEESATKVETLTESE